MAINFPSSPTNGQLHTESGVTWSYNLVKTVWVPVVAAITALPTACMLDWAGSNIPPTGFLLCDFAAVSRATYAALFAIIGTTYGPGDGSTTFNVPDSRGRVAVGAGSGIISEAIADANWNISNDIITVADNPVAKAKWTSGAKVQVTTTGTLPGNVIALTDYFVRRLSPTTISLYDTFARATDLNMTSGRINMNEAGTGIHTITSLLTTRSRADRFGIEIQGDVVSHKHDMAYRIDGSGTDGFGHGGNDNVPYTELFGQAEGVTQMQPSFVAYKIIKT